MRLVVDVLTVRPPISPDAANEKLAEAAFTGRMRFQRVGSEKIDRVRSSMARRDVRRIRFVFGLSLPLY